MRSTSAMQREVTENDEVQEGTDCVPDEPGDGDESLIAAKYIRAAVGAYEVQKQAAYDAGVKNESYFTKMCAGTKPAHVLHLWRLVQRNRKAARAVAEVFAAEARMVVAPMIDLKLEPQTAAVLIRLRRSLGLSWRAYRDAEVAPSLSATGDMVDVALDYHERIGR